MKLPVKVENYKASGDAIRGILIDVKYCDAYDNMMGIVILSDRKLAACYLSDIIFDGDFYELRSSN